MNTNSMQPKVIFIYSLPKNKVAEMEQKRFYYSLFISKIQGIEDVEVHELCENFFSTTHKCQILIVLGEYLGDEQALLLHDDSLFPLDELINKISISCNGVEVIDMAFCYSGEWREKLKKITNALVNGNNEKTQVEARLQLYPLLLLRKDLGRENYKESYDIILDKLEKKQNRRNPQELANLPESTKLGTMSTSAVPKEVYRNSPFPVKVYIHADGDKVDIVAEIDGYRPHTISNLKLNNGDKISWELCFDTDPKPEYAQYLEHIKGERSYFDTWNSDEPEIRRTFNFFVEEAFPLNGFNGVLKTTIGENKLDEWPFTVTVLPYKEHFSKLKEENLHQEVIECDAHTINSYIRDIKIGSDEYKNMSLNDMQIHIDKKLREYNRTGMAGRIRQDYYDLQDEINKKIKERENNKDVIYDDSFLKGQRERLYILDKRMDMLKSLNEIGKAVDGMFESKVFSKEARCEVKKLSACFFELVSDDFYDTYLKRIYTDEKGEIKFFYDGKEKDDDGKEFTKEILRREYNGLAIMLSKPQMCLDDLHKCLYYEIADKRNEEQKIPNAVFLNKKGRNVGIMIIPYINKIKIDKKLESELDNYLHSKEGHSSVIAYFLREICRSNKK